MMATAIIEAGTTSGGGSAPQAPTASFSFSSNPIAQGSVVTFLDTSINNPTGWSWTVNGGVYSVSQNPSMYCSTVGFITVGLTVTNAYGSSGPTYQALEVTSGGIQP